MGKETSEEEIVLEPNVDNCGLPKLLFKRDVGHSSISDSREEVH